MRTTALSPLDLFLEPIWMLTRHHLSIRCIPLLAPTHIALIYPIENMEVVNVVNSLIFTINRMHQEGPGSLSNNLLWYYENSFTELPYKLEDQKLTFYPTSKFAETLNELKPAPGKP